MKKEIFKYLVERPIWRINDVDYQTVPQMNNVRFGEKGLWYVRFRTLLTFVLFVGLFETLAVSTRKLG